MADGINQFAEYLKTRTAFARVRNAEKAIAAFRANPVGQSAALGLKQADEARALSIETGEHTLAQRKIIDLIKTEAAETARDRAAFAFDEEKRSADVKFETAEINKDIAKLKKEALEAPSAKSQTAYFRGYEFEIDPSGGVNFSKDEVQRDKYDQDVISKTVGTGTFKPAMEGSNRAVEEQIQAFTPLEIEKANETRYDRMLSIEAMSVARELGVNPELVYQQIEKTIEFAKAYRTVIPFSNDIRATQSSYFPFVDYGRDLAQAAYNAGLDVDEFAEFIYGGKIGSYGLEDALQYADYSLNILGR